MTLEPCTCEDWEIGVSSLNAILSLSALRGSSPKYSGEEFRYCPWCGSKLKEKEDA